MSCLPSKTVLVAFSLTLIVSGCAPSRKPVYLNDGGDLSHYVGQATAIEYPDVDYATLDEVTQAYSPITVMDPDFDAYEDMTLERAVSIALSNSKIIRGYGTPSLQATRVSPGQDGLANSPGVAASSYDLAIRQSEPGFLGQPGQIASPSALTTNGGLDGNQGVESALADFDAQLTSNVNYSKSDEPRNGSSILNNEVFQQDQVTWQSEIAKKSASGTQIFFRNINQYTANNNPLIADGGIQILDSFYRTSLEAEIRQPLLRGRGTFINRMPIVISRIGSDQQLANLEATLQNKVTNVEIRYWDLYCAYRNFDAAKTGRDAALETWRIVYNQYEEGAEVNIQQVAQSSEQYNFFDGQVIDAFNNVLSAESDLRYLLGWSATDGKILRPIDLPVMAPIEFDWCTSLCEALTYRPELRQQRWEIKKKQLSLAYSKNGLLPELNVSLLYRWLGLGNKYGSTDDGDVFPAADSAALNEMYNGNFQELQFSGTFAMPIGFRRELSNVRNAQLKLALEMARIEDQELDISRNLTKAFQALAANQMIMQASFNRWKDTTIEEDHFKRLEDAGVELDVALDAQRRRSQAEVAFYTALCEYNKVIALIHRRKGTILTYSGISFNEGAWPGKAYLDADEHARRRGASRELNYGWTRPEVISRGENWPSPDNIGGPLTAYPREKAVEMPVENYGVAPFSDSMIDDIPLEGIPFNGQTVPYYESPAPTPVYQGSDNRGTTASTVRQVNYIEDVPPTTTVTPAVPPNALRQQTVRQAQQIPKTNNHAAIVPAVPQRDRSAQPTRRLQAQTPLDSANAGQTSAGSNAVLRTGNLSWEKMGLERPTQPSNVTRARIKMN
ncbi:MAG: outer membrane protein TolC [Mariniblastus sp.]|jgi:outer membrane protein TolC